MRLTHGEKRASHGKVAWRENWAIEREGEGKKDNRAVGCALGPQLSLLSAAASSSRPRARSNQLLSEPRRGRREIWSSEQILVIFVKMA